MRGWKELQAGVFAALVISACGGARAAGGQVVPAGEGTISRGAAAGAAAPACDTPDDSTGTSISGTFRARPEPIYAAGAAALRDLGFVVLENMPPRELLTAPSHSWPTGTANEPWHGPDHPGLEVFLFTRTTADSTTVAIGARALCRVASAPGGVRSSEVGTNLENIVTMTAMNALITRLRGAPRP